MPSARWATRVIATGAYRVRVRCHSTDATEAPGIILRTREESCRETCAPLRYAREHGNEADRGIPVSWRYRSIAVAVGFTALAACFAPVPSARKDEIMPMEASDELARSIPGTRLELVEHCGHLSSIEQLAAVTALLHA